MHCNIGKDGQHDGYYIDKVFAVYLDAIIPDSRAEDSDKEKKDKDHYYQYLLNIITNIRPE